MERVRQMQRIKELRKEKSMNQIALGMELNFSQKIISEYENGKVEPSITTLKKLASIFNTSVDYIIEYTDIKQPIDKIAQSELSETECKLLNEFRCLPKEKQNKQMASFPKRLPLPIPSFPNVLPKPPS